MKKLTGGMESEDSKLIKKQVEGVHYTMVYEGSKLFWRTQWTVDVMLWYHILPHTIEAIFFDGTKELNRLYLDYFTIVNIIEKSGKLQEILDAKLAELTKNRFAEVPDEMILRKEIITGLVISFIMARLQPEELPYISDPIMEKNNDADETANEIHMVELEKKSSKVCFQSSADDTIAGFKSALLLKPPSVLVPVKLSRRRASITAADIEDAVTYMKDQGKSMDEDLAKARHLSMGIDEAFDEAARKAEKIAAHIYSAASFMNEKQAIIKRYENRSIARKRWHSAQARILLRIKKNKMIAHLADLEAQNAAAINKP